MAFHVEQWRCSGISKFAVERRADRAFVGRVGVQLLDPVTWDPAAGRDGVAELGWTLMPGQRGRGYATEAALAVRAWYGGNRLISLIAPDNLPSQRVAERLGAVPGESVMLSDSSRAVLWLHPDRSRPSASSSAARG